MLRLVYLMGMSLSSLYLDAFFATARKGNFTLAAEQLFITQSALSQRIAKLEAELNTTLFIRAPSGIQLTTAGLELLRYCTAKESLENEALSRMTGKESQKLSGVIRIGGFSSIMRSMILPALAPLLTQNPEVKLSLVSKEMDELPQMLKQGEIDYMIHYNPIYKDEIETIHLGDELNVLVEKKGYNGPNIFLDHDENDQATAKYLKSKKEKKRYERRYLDDVYGLIDGVKLGLGRAIIPKHLIHGDKDLKVIDSKVTLKFPIILHFHRQPFYTKLHKEIIQHLLQI